MHIKVHDAFLDLCERFETWVQGISETHQDPTRHIFEVIVVGRRRLDCSYDI